MKKIFLFLPILILIISSTYGQSLKYKEVRNNDLVHVLNNIKQTISFTSDNRDLYIKIFNVGDPSGSAHTGESDEITSSIYIAVSDGGEGPEQHLYRLPSIYNPKFLNWIKTSNGPKIQLTYGPFNKRKTITILITLKKLLIQ